MLNTKFWWFAALLTLILAIGIQASYIVGPASAPITPSTGTPGFIQTAEAHQNSTASLSVSFLSLPAINHAVLVAGTFNGVSIIPSLDGKISDNQGNSYARIVLQSPDGQANVGTSLWCTIVTASSGTYTVTGDSNTGAVKGLMILEYGSTSCNPDRIIGHIGAASPYACGSITTKNPKDLLIAILGIAAGAIGTVTFMAPTGFAIKNSFGVAANGNPMAVADEVVSAVNTFAPTFSASQNIALSQCAFAAMISN